MIIALIKSVLALLWLTLLMFPSALAMWLGAETLRKRLVAAAYSGVGALFGVHVQMHGTLPEHRPLLLISNHSSYLDILVLGGTIPLSFTPKKEIASWPVIGFCAKLSGCVFVERTRSAVAQAQENITTFLQNGGIMCVFAEGTTNDGNALKPFKSALFSVAELPGVMIQPATVIYRKAGGRALDAQGRRRLAWFGDDSLVPHLVNVLRGGRIHADIYLHPLIEPQRPIERKALCAQTEQVINDCFASQIKAQESHD